MSQQKHVCNHDSEQFQPHIVDLSEQQINNNGQKRILTEVWGPIRITYDFTDIESMSSVVKDSIKQQLQLAAQYFSRALKVIRISGNNIFPSNINSCGPEVTTIPADDKNTGIADSDLHIYVTKKNENSSTLASAGACIIGGDHRRPNFGRIIFNEFHFNSAVDNRKFEDQYEISLHELTHVMGFSNGLFEHFYDRPNDKLYDSYTMEKQVRNVTMTYLTTPKVKEVARNHFGCPTLEGMQLENNGGGGSVGSHWERVTLENEYMTASARSHDAVFSEFTLALLEDSGWYQPDYTQADPMLWGKNKGCAFLENCDAANYREFQEGDYGCNFYYTAVTGKNTNQDPYGEECQLPSYITNFICTDEDNMNNSNNNLAIDYQSQYFGHDSRCFKSNVVQTGVNITPERNHRCLQFQCLDGSDRIQVQVKGEWYDIDKPSNKVTIAPRGTNNNNEGDVFGPHDWHYFCSQAPKICPQYCSQKGMCLKSRCYCDTDFAGEDCTISCVGGNYVHDGTCLGNQNCPVGTTVQEGTKICKDNCSPTQKTHNGECVDTCPDSTYEDGSECKPCSENCEKCTDDTSCDKCVSDTYKNLISSGPDKYDCVNNCPDKQWGDDDTGECSPCMSKCATCSSGSSCDTCDPARYTYTDGDGGVHCLAECFNGWFGNDEKVCEICDVSCKKCSNKTSCDVCADKYFSDTPGVLCTPCDTGCLTCENDTYCISCEPDTYEHETGPNQLKCPTECPDKYWENDSTGSCSSCDNSCETCTDQNSCDTCPDKKFRDASNNNFCTGCMIGCQTCTNSTSCDSCQGGRYSFQESASVKKCVLNCEDKYYKHDDSMECKECNASCKTCDKESACNSCIDGKFQPDSDSHCTGDCSDGCLECDNDQTCRKCDPARYSHQAEVDKIVCEVNCPAKFYEDNDNMECDPCHTSCATCTKAGECETCDLGKYKDDDTKLCETCISGCEECSNGTACTKCVAGRYLDDSNVCQQHCPDKFYGDDSQRKCIGCHESCSQCSDDSSCDSCVERKFKNGGTNLCTEDCLGNCLECLNDSTCSKCDTNHFHYTDELNAEFCREDCPAEKFFEDTDNQKCEKCQNTCKTCPDKNSCQTCYDKFYPNGFCDPCASGCQTCDNDQFCLTCESGKYALEETPDQIQCVTNCPAQNYFENDDNQTCTSCDVRCVECSAADKCSKCIDQKYQTIVDGICDGDCLTDCKTCADGTTCSKCMGTKKILSQDGQDDQCVDTCPTEKFYPGTDRCEDCESSCLTCENDSECQTCDSKFYKDTGNTNLCKPCLAGCQACSDDSTCDTCAGDRSYVNEDGNNKCVLNCTGNQFEDGDVCTDCDGSCAACSAAGSCDSCPDTKYRHDSTLLCSETCADGCVKCSLDGQTCNDTPPGECSSNEISVDKDEHNVNKCVPSSCVDQYLVLNRERVHVKNDDSGRTVTVDGGNDRLDVMHTLSLKNSGTYEDIPNSDCYQVQVLKGDGTVHFTVGSRRMLSGTPTNYQQIDYTIDKADIQNDCSEDSSTDKYSCQYQTVYSIKGTDKESYSVPLQFVADLSSATMTVGDVTIDYPTSDSISVDGDSVTSPAVIQRYTDDSYSTEFEGGNSVEVGQPLYLEMQSTQTEIQHNYKLVYKSAKLFNSERGISIPVDPESTEMINHLEADIGQVNKLRFVYKASFPGDLKLEVIAGLEAKKTSRRALSQKKKNKFSRSNIFLNIVQGDFNVIDSPFLTTEEDNALSIVLLVLSGIIVFILPGAIVFSIIQYKKLLKIRKIQQDAFQKEKERLDMQMQDFDSQSTIDEIQHKKTQQKLKITI